MTDDFRMYARTRSVPPEIARAFVRSASRLNQAAAIGERPALWTHANRTVFMTLVFRAVDYVAPG
jgi:hypothetical protein